MAQFRDLFDAAQDPQAAAFALRLGQLYNVTQPTFAIGELIYSDTTTTLASLAPNTAASKKFLSMTGTGSAGAAPVWETIEAADITDFSEAVDDRVDALIQDGTGITWTYDDSANTLTGNVTITQYTDEMAQDAAASLIQNGTGISWSYSDGANTLTPTVTLAPFTTTNLAEGSNLYYTDERVDDRVDALIQDADGITWTYNDGAGTLTPALTTDIAGTTTNDNADAGDIGQIIDSTVASGSAVSLTTATAADVTSISLTAGDWDVEGVVNILPASTTSFTLRSASISETSATMDNTSGRFNFHPTPAEVPGANSFSLPLTRVRKSFASTTTVYLVARCVFTVSTAAAFGYISARRVR